MAQKQQLNAVNTLIPNLLGWKNGAYLHFKDVFLTLRLRSHSAF